MWCFRSLSLTPSYLTNAHTRRETKRESGLCKVAILDTFQGFCQSLWRSGKYLQQFNDPVVTMVERYLVEAPFPGINVSQKSWSFSCLIKSSNCRRRNIFSLLSSRKFITSTSTLVEQRLKHLTKDHLPPAHDVDLQLFFLYI